MKSISQLLEIRKKIRAAQPNFTRQEYPARIKLDSRWRKPKGIHSKMKDKKRGKKKQPSVGYSAPREVRGLTNEGLKPILIENLKSIENVTKENIIVLSKQLGMKKRIALLKKIKEKKLKILNVKDIDAKINALLENINKRKKEKQERMSKKKKEIKKEEKQKEKQEDDSEDKKKKEQEEKRKVLEGKK